MTTLTVQSKKTFQTTTLLLAALIVLVLVTGSVVQTQWFSDLIRSKIIKELENSTGAKVEVAGFRFEPFRLTVRITGLVVHGTEATTQAPLAQVSSLELRLKLFTGFRKVFDLAYLDVDTPRVDITVNPDGSTNIPEPKVRAKPNSESPLATVVDLAVGELRLENGLLVYGNQTIPLNVRGDDLRVSLDFNSLRSAYQGFARIDALKVAVRRNPPLVVRVNLPLEIRRDGLSLSKAQLDTASSHVLISASLNNAGAPQLAVSAGAKLFLPEIGQSLALPMATNDPALSKYLTLDLDTRIDQKANNVALQYLRLGLGKTTLNAAGTSNPANGDAIEFSGEVALGQISQLLEVSSPQIAGALMVNGSATFNRDNHYDVHGTISSRALSIANGSTKLSNVSLATPFQINPNLISLDSLRLSLLGGNISTRISIRDLNKVSADGEARNISLGALCSMFAGGNVGYGGSISGMFAATDSLQAGREPIVNASARLSITPAGHGVPVRGVIDAQYEGGSGLVDLKNLHVSLPASELNATGSLKKLVHVSLVSRNLSDFLPFTKNSGGTVPVILKGGMLRLDTDVQGDLSEPRMSGQAGITHFVVQDRRFDNLLFNFAASPDGVSVQKGTLWRDKMQVALDGSISLKKWKPVSSSKISSNITIRNGDLGDLLALAGESSSNNHSDDHGDVEADVHIGGTYGNPLGSVKAELSKGMALGQPFDDASANARLTPGLITLDALRVDAARGKIALTGTFQHPADRFTAGHADLHLQTSGVNLAQIAALQQKNAGIEGIVALSASVTADVHDNQGQNRVGVSNVNADFSASGLRIRNQDAGGFSAMARTSSGDVIYSAHSDFAGSAIAIDGRTKLSSDYPTTARAFIRNLSTAKALQLVGQTQVPVDGILSADATVAGDLKFSEASLGLELTKASIYQETVNRLTAQIQYKNGLLGVPQLEVVTPAGSVSLSGRYARPTGLKTGELQLRVDSSDLDTAKSRRIQQLEPGISGKVRVNADLAATITAIGNGSDLQLSNLNGQVSALGLYRETRKIGDLKFTARTNQGNVTFQLDSELAQSEIRAFGLTQLAKDYPTRATATFKNVRYENIAPLLGANAAMQVPIQALVEGKASLDGPILNTNLLAAAVELSRLEISSSQRRSTSEKGVSLKNDQPIAVTFVKNLLTVQRFSMRGTDTSVDVTGSVNMADGEDALHLNVGGNLDLGILQQTDRDFYSSGALALKTTVAGTLSNPLLNGRIVLENANINYANAPNGISNANGIIQLSGNTAVVQKLTAESGGGQVQISGSVGVGSGTAIYNLRAKAAHVRTRYDNASVTSSANISLNGNSRLSLLAGRIIVERIAYSSSSDMGSLLANASSPPSTPSEPSPMLSGMRLDIQITTASDLRVSSTYVEKLDVNSNLTVRGTAAEPGILGHLNITDGQLVFFGNTYSVNNGSINFYDASSIRPELNLSLETVAQGVDVTLGVKGPVSNMKLTYQSDPPLTFQQIVQLLATNTTPFDPTIAAHQPTAPQQSLSQMGESEVLGEAVANPVASRLQRVFGLSQFKIDPSVAGNNGQPTAKVTLSQKITKEVTFTYITDVTQTNSEIVRVQWDLGPKTSAVALRDYNGNVSVQLFHKFQIR